MQSRLQAAAEAVWATYIQHVGCLLVSQGIHIHIQQWQGPRIGQGILQIIKRLGAVLLGC